MKAWICGLIGALALLWAPATPAQEARATIADAAWMAGRWVGEGLGGQMEEAWSTPADGQMTGYFRLVRDGRVVFTEIMLIDEYEGGLRMRVKHFDRDFVGWEERGEWVAFAFESVAPGEIRWRGLSMTRTSDTEMTGLIRIRYGENDVREEVLRYRRAPL